MDTLVICIDRDNDLGEKAKVITPVVGRGANVAAAVSLATVDPEDSDTNTIFGGIRILDELRRLGVDADIVSFAGDKNVGAISDKKIADQLDEFLSMQEVKSAIFVSDGAEDESLVPIVQSRVKVDSVQRIVVMQSERLESTYYMIKNFLKDPKFLQTFFVPIGLALIIYAMAMIANQPQLAIIGTFFIVGMYMILRAYSLNEKIAIGWSNLKNSFQEHQLSFVTTITSILLLTIGTIAGVIDLWKIVNFGNIGYYGIIPLLSLFIKRTVLWYAAAVFVYILGQIFDRIYSKKDYQDLIVEMLFALSGTLLFWSAGSYVLSITMPEGGYVFHAAYFVYSIIVAVIIAIAGIYFSAVRTVSEEEEEPKKPAEKEKPPRKSEKIVTIDMTDDGEDDDEDGSVSEPVKVNIGARKKK
ncbi:MAG: DUF373 family protein [Methanimicrococcus sp.]|nr:DUF373 family protein [Methanimicrococcus sp.]